MTMTPEYVDGIKVILNNPKEYNFDFKPFKDCFVESEIVTPKDVLAKQFLNCWNNSALNKFLVYLLMNDVFGECTEKAENGSLGYKLQTHPDIIALLIKDVMTTQIF